MTQLDEARRYVKDLLALADGDSDAVYRAIDRAERAGKAGATREEAERNGEGYAMQRLALADLTGNPGYRL